MKVGAKHGVASHVLSRLPVPVTVALGFSLFVAVPLLLAPLLPPPRDAQTECTKQCAPRQGQLIADKSYPMSAKGTYRQVCECR